MKTHASADGKPAVSGAAGQTVVVVGGSGGLGQAVCRCLADEQRKVFITYRSGQRAAAQVAERLPTGTSIGIGQMDVTDRASISRLRDSVMHAAGSIGGVVFASGVDIAQPRVADASEQEWRGVIETELMGFINIVQEFLPIFRAQRYGTFVSVVTYANYTFPVGDALSSVPKAGIEALTRALAKEEGRNGIRANCVAPGIINAGLGAKLQEQLYGQEIWDRQKRRVPLRRFGEAEDVAEAVAFLVSEKARYITGCTLLVDGGMHL
ncbi:MAG: SDR family NAD(P)-dependent oxidoreductase [Burkholderiales bacterium]